MKTRGEMVMELIGSHSPGETCSDDEVQEWREILNGSHILG